MGFSESVSFSDPTVASDPQDGVVQQAMNEALVNWSQYISGVGTLIVQLNVAPLGAGVVADGGPTSAQATGQVSNGNQLVTLSSATELTTGGHLAASDIIVDFNSSYLASYASAVSGTLVGIFEHELMHGFGMVGYRNDSGQLPGYETAFDALSQFTPSGQDFFTGANAVAAYGGPVPLTTTLPGSDYYHLGATGTASDPAVLHNDIINPYGSSNPISGLDVAILEDAGIPITAAGQALINAEAATAVSASSAVAAVFAAVLGRSPTTAELFGAEENLSDGASLANIRAYLATTGEAAGAILAVSSAVLGRASTAAEVAGAEQSLASGGSLANIRAYLATTGEAAGAISAVSSAVLGRASTAAEVAGAEQSLASGGSLSGVRAYLATTGEAANAITAVFNADLGRAPLAADLPGLEQALANGATIANFRSYFAGTAESANAITATFQQTVGRAPSAADIANIQADFAAGWSVSGLRSVLATSAEEGTDITRAYQNDLGRAASPADTAASEQYIAGGGSLQALQSSLVGSAEFASDINTATQAALGRPANAVEIAADRSQVLSSYSTAATIHAQIAELSGGDPPSGNGAVVAITPQTIAGSGPNLVYGLLNNDAALSAHPLTVLDEAGAGLSLPIITGFNPATDVIQLQSHQDASFAALSVSPITGGTSIYVGNGASIDLNGIAPASLTAANFRFV